MDWLLGWLLWLSKGVLGVMLAGILAYCGFSLAQFFSEEVSFLCGCSKKRREEHWKEAVRLLFGAWKMCSG